MENELIVMNAPKSKVSEMFRTLRSNLQFNSKTYKTFLITSSLSGEGKSFVSANLAVTFAQTGKKTLIIDADMRRGRQHEIFYLNPDKGLSNVLITDVKNEYSEYIQTTKIENLDVLTRGIIPPNPSELLNADSLPTLIKELENIYDVIIVDGTPTVALSDALILASCIKRVAVVTSLNYTPKESFDQTMKALEAIDCSIAGVIANNVVSKEKNSAYYEYYTL